MKKVMARALRWFGLGLVIVAATGAVYEWLANRKALAANPAPGDLVDVGGHRLHIWCTGTGAPAVILDAGLGSTALAWATVQREVARFTQVCSYDRAGMGYSDPGPMPRTSLTIVRELASLLDRRNLRDRVVLAGASFGGWNVRLFASEYEDRVAGLVLVDARHEDQGEQLAAVGAPDNPPWVIHLAPLIAYSGMARVLGITPGESDPSLDPSLKRFAAATALRASGIVAAASELSHGRASARQVKAARRQFTVPVVVVSAGRRSGGPGVGKVLDDLQRDQTRLSPHGCRIVAEHAGHNVAKGQPQAVVDGIRAAYEAARGRAFDASCRPTDANGEEIP